MKFTISLIFSFFIYSFTFAQQYTTAAKEVDHLLTQHLQEPYVHHAFLTVYSDALGINWNFTKGHFQNGTKVTNANPFLSTSVAKTVTATLIMILQEEGKLDVEDRLSEYLSSEIMNGLHNYQGTDYSNEIRIKQLLQHTSGLPDYFVDTPTTGASFMELLFIDAERFWQPLETLQFAKTKLLPHFPPGDGYHYSDTEYVLLGLLIEELTGKPLHDVYHEKIFAPLQMKQTYMHLRSKPTDSSTKKIAEVFINDVEISAFKSLSADWAGGGLATTAQDLLKFHNALFEEKLISKKGLRAMQQWTEESFGLSYGYGLRKLDLKKINPDFERLTLIGHSGTTGSFMYYCKELELYFTGTFNQTDYQRKHVAFLMQVLAVIKQSK